MRKNKPEEIVKLLRKNGIRLYKWDDDIGCDKDLNKPVLTLLKIHINELCEHFGVSKP